jgi:hypothetical protein
MAAATLPVSAALCSISGQKSLFVGSAIRASFGLLRRSASGTGHASASVNSGSADGAERCAIGAKAGSDEKSRSDH